MNVEKHVICKILKYIFIAWIIIILSTPEQYAARAYMFAMIPFAAASAMIFNGAYEKCKFDKNLSLISVVLTILFLLQLTVFEIYAKFTSDNAFIKVIFCIVFTAFLAIALYILLYTVLSYATGEKNIQEQKLKKIKYIGLYYITIPIVCVSVAYLLGSYTIVEKLNADPAGVWSASAESNWDEWHTIGYLLFTRIFSMNSTNINIIFVFQCIFWIYICNYAIDILYRRFHSKKICMIYSLITAIIFSPAIYNGFLIKDVIYCMCLLLFVLSFIDALDRKELTLKLAVQIALSGFGVSIFRHAGWVSIFAVLIAWCVYKFIKKQKFTRVLAIALVVVCASIFVNNVVSRNILHATENPAYVKYSVPMYMIGAVANKVEDIPKKDVEVMEQVIPLQQWREYSASNRYWADTLSRTWGGVGNNIEKLNDPKIGRDIIMLNLKWLFKYPQKYISSAFDITSILWETSRPADGYEWPPITDEAFNKTVSTVLMRNFSDTSSGNALLNPFYWRGGLWLFMLILSIVILIIKKLYKYLFAVAVPAIAILLLFISVPSQDPRFILFLIECVPFILIFSLFSSKQGNDKGVGYTASIRQ